MTLRVIEKKTQWVNLAGLCIGMVKEAVHKDMLQSDCQPVF